VSAQPNAELRQVDVKELPAELWSAAQGPLLYGFTGTSADGALALAVTRHDDVPVLTSTIDSANAVTVLTKDGQSVTRVAYYTRNHLKQFLVLDLPSGAEVWSVFVNGRASKPSRNKDGQLLVPLDKSDLRGDDAAFPVEIVYHSQAVSLGLAGRTRPSLPKVDLPISQLVWSLYAPENVSLLHVSGNVEAQDALVMMAGAPVKDLRSMARGDREGYLRGAMKAIVSNDAPAAPEEKVAARQAAMELDVIADKDEGAAMTQAHVLPIAFRLPEAGHLYRFAQIMVTRDAPAVSLTYAHRGLVRALRWFLVLCALVAIFLFRNALATCLQRLTSRVRAGFLHPLQPDTTAR
jgi:hypothetical protein